ncbi:WPP domain-associated protein-like [Brassica rapa]|uniref:WPP domain-associated protein-like n=1 Tax=Brassica campestris TaxID=3711 RepID=UPI0004F1C451|nr:WPP domain-associated protein-like [Brassica rapa]
MDAEVMFDGTVSLDSQDHDESVLVDNSVIKENPDVDFLENDMNNHRLTVSRFVSDTVETLAADKIAQTQVELSSSEGNETSQSRLILDYGETLLVQESCGLVLEKAKEIAGLRRELELISKLLSGREKGDIKALEDHEGTTDILQRKVSGKHIGSVTSKPENLEYLRQLPRDELINHFKTEMNQLKREHECTMQEMTEEYFSIKRRCLKLEECPSLSFLNKDKDFNVLRKKIPDIISKLDKVVLEGEKLKGKNNADSKRELDFLLLENSQLKDSLSEAGEKVSHHRELVRKLESDVEDLHVEASIYEDVYRSFVGEFVNQFQCAKEEANLEREEASGSKIALEDSCVESYMKEEYCAIMYKEALKEAGEKLVELKINVSERERAMGSEIAEKGILKEKIHSLECLVKEKENDLDTVREKLEIVCQHVNNLQSQVDQQAVVIQDQSKELGVASSRDLEKTKGYVMEISELRQKLELARKDMKITENERMKSELKLSSTQAEQKLLQDQIVSTVLSLAKWSQDFECLVAEKTKKTNYRLKSMQSQLNDLIDEVDELKIRESMYKQQMEKKTCDLQKAETEVDLLGDEIDSLLDLLQKIYIALDHYSPILKHYPGIMEILKLVQRELRKGSKRLSVF